VEGEEVVSSRLPLSAGRCQGMQAVLSQAEGPLQRRHIARQLPASLVAVIEISRPTYPPTHAPDAGPRCSCSSEVFWRASWPLPIRDLGAYLIWAKNRSFAPGNRRSNRQNHRGRDKCLARRHKPGPRCVRGVVLYGTVLYRPGSTQVSLHQPCWRGGEAGGRASGRGSPPLCSCLLNRG
jgi:hypothetical protein